MRILRFGIVAALLATFASQLALTAATAAAAKRTSAIPRTPQGRPDMQGIWVHGTTTPFERPPDLGTQAYYSEDEFRLAKQRLADRRAQAARTARPGDVGGDNEAFVDSDYSMLDTRQTSLVVDPPDGRLPIRPEALTRAKLHLDGRDDYETMSPWDRCITRSPTLMLPAGYNNATRIVQTPDFIMLEAEMVHEARVVPTDNSPHPPARIGSWLGDSRGRWEGDTFVIDSANYHDRGWVSTHAGSGRLRGVANSTALHIVERFTMTGAETITYEMTVDDPAVYTRPWTVSLPLRRDASYVMYESACHEGNQAIGLVLRGARFEERNGTR